MTNWIKAFLRALSGRNRTNSSQRNDLVRKRFEDAALARKKAAYKKTVEESRDSMTVNRLHTGAGTTISETTGMHRDFDRCGFM